MKRTQVQIVVDAIKRSGREGISYESLCGLIEGTHSQIKSRVSLITRTLVEADVVTVEETAGHRNLVYHWNG